MKYSTVTIGKGDLFAAAAWVALAAGLLEGVILTVTRSFPKVLAPYKASARLLWVAPLVDLVVFALAAVVLLAVLRLVRRGGWPEPKVALAVLLFLGWATVLETPKVLHPASVVVLTAGLTTVAVRAIGGRESALIGALRRRLVLIPVVLVVLAAAVWAADRLGERVRAGRLPAVQTGASR